MEEGKILNKIENEKMNLKWLNSNVLIKLLTFGTQAFSTCATT